MCESEMGCSIRYDRLQKRRCGVIEGRGYMGGGQAICERMGRAMCWEGRSFWCVGRVCWLGERLVGRRKGLWVGERVCRFGEGFVGRGKGL